QIGEIEELPVFEFTGGMAEMQHARVAARGQGLLRDQFFGKMKIEIGEPHCFSLQRSCWVLAFGSWLLAVGSWLLPASSSRLRASSPQPWPMLHLAFVFALYILWQP